MASKTGGKKAAGSPPRRTSRDEPAPPKRSTRKAAAAAKGAAAVSPDRRKEILDVAAELFAVKGVANTTVRDIGNAVGILSGSLYYYFESKEAMVAEILSDYLRVRLEECIRISEEYPDPRERFEELLRTEFREVDEHRWAAQIYQQEFRHLLSLPAEVQDVARGVRHHWLAAINEGVEQGQFRSDINQELFHLFARRASNLVHSWVGALSVPQELGKKYSVDVMAQEIIEILMNGYATAD